MSAPNHFTRRWAIRMPDGNLYTGADPRAAEKAAEQAEQYWDTPSPMRDMGSSAFMAMLGLTGPRTPTTPQKPKPQIFDTREAAERLFKELCARAEAVGVPNWGGCVVESLCTPFTSGDPSVDFANEVTAWVAKRGASS